LIYELEGSQLEYLKRHSLIGTQQIYKECSIKSNQISLPNLSITLYTDNGNELSYGHPYLGYEIIQSNCHFIFNFKILFVINEWMMKNEILFINPMKN
ncbi:unnamed protein product, partial [Schistosoma curassoni]|uniref:CUB domain-containing protein n=1 Tax=Schistosoma curassoni TaxID=6186 RepID=A0A183KHN3_9TREM